MYQEGEVPPELPPSLTCRRLELVVQTPLGSHHAVLLCRQEADTVLAIDLKFKRDKITQQD